MIVVVPAATPVIIPVPEPIDASEGAALLQEPPGDASATDVVVPGQTVVAPVIGSGVGFTDVVLVAAIRPVQPLISVAVTV